mgnify:CR=1 FL=1
MGLPTADKTITVNALDLFRVLKAFMGAPHELMELRVLAHGKLNELLPLEQQDPVSRLVKQYNYWADPPKPAPAPTPVAEIHESINDEPDLYNSETHLPAGFQLGVVPEYEIMCQLRFEEYFVRDEYLPFGDYNLYDLMVDSPSENFVYSREDKFYPGIAIHGLYLQVSAIDEERVVFLPLRGEVPNIQKDEDFGATQPLGMSCKEKGQIFSFAGYFGFNASTGEFRSQWSNGVSQDCRMAELSRVFGLDKPVMSTKPLGVVIRGCRYAKKV